VTDSAVCVGPCLRDIGLLLTVDQISRSRWPRGLWRRSAAAWLLGSRDRITLRVWMFIVFICCVVLCR
jgi:hypothetical protein